MKKSFNVVVSALVTITFAHLTGCMNQEDLDKRDSGFTKIGGIREVDLKPVTNCIVVSSVLTRGQLYRIVLKDPRPLSYRLLAGFSGKPLSVGSMASWIMVLSTDGSDASGYFTHVVEAENK